MRLFKKITAVAAAGLLMMFASFNTAQAARVIKERILFIPHDCRPISCEQTAETLRQAGWEVIVPPEELLGSYNRLGNPEKVWEWLENNSRKANAAVISSDTMLYGSLVGSRKHSYSESQIMARVKRFAEFKSVNPQLDLYVFGSIMRTPRSGENSGSMEPGYYDSYGSDIFRYTALVDKEEIEGLTRREKKEHAFLQQLIPAAALDDWLSRRNKNFRASQRLIDLVKNNVFEYLALGRDDNAPYSQTHMESRKLDEYGKALGDTRFQTMAGIDEFAMLMLTRAVNNINKDVPFVFVRYNWGRGEYTVPAYSDEPISKSIRDHIVAAGGIQVIQPGKADLVLVVNTDPNGRTFEGGSYENVTKARPGTKYCADIVSEYVAAGRPVGVADVSFANGSDNAFMEMLKNRGLLFKLRAYSGWNTATNSTGFAIGQGMLTGRMSDAARDKLLLTRYLDDWAYQANVRNVMARQLGWFRASGAYSALNENREAVEERTTKFMHRFVEENLPPFAELRNLRIFFPWNRMFEAKYDLTEYSLIDKVRGR